MPSPVRNFNTASAQDIQALKAYKAAIGTWMYTVLFENQPTCDDYYKVSGESADTGSYEGWSTRLIADRPPPKHL